MNSSQHGSVMVEMAGAITLLVFLVFGITELGRALYQLNMINKAVTSGARYMARSTNIITAPSESPPCSSTGDWSAAKGRAINLVTFGNENGTGEPLFKNITVTIPEPEVRTYTLDAIIHSDCVITVHAETIFESLFGGSIYPPLFGRGDESEMILRADAEDRYLRINYAPATP